jgi:hypothetical protein
MSELKKHTDKDLADAHVLTVDPLNGSAGDNEFRLMRQQMNGSLTPEQGLYAKVMQLKFMMEDMIEDTENDGEADFGFYLQEYINILGQERSDFAEDIGLKSNELYKLLQNQTVPTDEILVRLELHSESRIPAILWYKMIERAREKALNANTELRLSQRVFVKRRLVA